VLYLVDARAVLRPGEATDRDEDVDWSCVGLFDQAEKTPSVSLHQTRWPEPRMDIAEIAIVSSMALRHHIHS
jgi:hypothetical protein